MQTLVLSMLRMYPDGIQNAAQGVVERDYVDVEPLPDDDLGGIRYRFVQAAFARTQALLENSGLAAKHRRAYLKEHDYRNAMTWAELSVLPLPVWKAVIDACVAGESVAGAFAERWSTELDLVADRLPDILQEIMKGQSVS